MNNFAGCIEGGSTLRVGFSDLKSRNSERFDARLHGAGINDEENAGRYSKTDECHIGRQRFGLSLRTVGATSWSGEGYGLLVVSAPDNTAPHYPRNHGNPYIEKEARLRPQHFAFVVCSTQSRRKVVQRKSKPLWSRATSIFGGGDCSFANASEGFKGWGADEVASPRS
jgi:hypothetical protein